MIQSVDTSLAGSVTSQTQCPNCGHKGVSGEAVCTQCGQSMYSAEAQSLSNLVAAENDPRNIEAAYETTPAEWEEGSNRSGLQAVAIEAALNANENDDVDAYGNEAADVSDPTDTTLSQAEQDDVRDLQDRDQEVRNHEQAHINAGGGVVQGGANYKYETGPDGQQYAVEGEVSVDVSSVPGDPDATQDKAKAVRRSALAPADPSAQDQNVAAKAAQMEAEARTEKQEEELEEAQETKSASTADASNALGAAMEAMEQPRLTNQQSLNSSLYHKYAQTQDEYGVNSSQNQKSVFISNYV